MSARISSKSQSCLSKSGPADLFEFRPSCGCKKTKPSPTTEATGSHRLLYITQYEPLNTIIATAATDIIQHQNNHDHKSRCGGHTLHIAIYLNLEHKICSFPTTSPFPSNPNGSIANANSSRGSKVRWGLTKLHRQRKSQRCRAETLKFDLTYFF